MSNSISLPTAVSSSGLAPSPIIKNLTDENLAHLMQKVIEKKEEHVHTALKGRVNVSEAVLIGGDLFSMGYLAFEGAKILRPALAAIPAISLGTLICGEIAGAINIGVGLVCLKEAIQAFKNGDDKLGLRLTLDFAAMSLIGAIMILASLATKLAVLGGIGAFFAANPWLLPVLFFIVSLPVMVEVCYRIKNIAAKKDLAAQLNTNPLQQLIRGADGKNPYHLQPLLQMDEHKAFNALSEKMEQFQADMGVAAALETFKLMQKHLRNEKTEEQLAVVRKRIAEWNKAQYIRLFQQILYASAFGISMGSLTPKLNTPAFNAATTFAMAGANALPLYMDAFWPFKRNTPIVVPKVDPLLAKSRTSDLNESV